MKSNTRRKIFINNMITYGIVAAAYIIMQVPVGTGHIPSLMKGLLVPFYIYVTMAVSLNLTVSTLGELSLGHTGFMCVGAFVGILFPEYIKGAIDPILGMVIVILIGAVTAALFDIIVGILVLRLRGDYLVVATLASGEIIKSLVNAVYLGQDAAGFYTSFKDSISSKMGEGGEMLIKGAQDITGTPQATTFTIDAILVLVTLFVVMNLVNSRMGHAIMAIHNNHIMAESIDIDITRCKLPTFSIFTGLAGITGVLYAHNLTTLTALPKNFDYNMSTMILVYVVPGGIGNIHGSAIATTILCLLSEMLHGLSDYRMLMYAIVLILAMFFNSASQFVVLHEHVTEKFSRKDKKPAKEAV